MTDSRWLHFSQEELSCPCCGKMDMDEDFMERLIAFRIHHGFKMKVTSGYRCDKRYEEVNPDSIYKAHKGHAVDIRIAKRQLGMIFNPERGEPSLQDFGFTGVGVKGSDSPGMVILHLDDINRGHGLIVWGY